MCRSIPFVQFEKCLVITSSSILSTPCSLSFPSGTPTMHMVAYLTVSHRYLRLCSNFSFFFLSFSFISYFFCQLQSVTEPFYWIFHFSDYTFQLQNFPLCFLQCLCLYWYSLFNEKLSPGLTLILFVLQFSKCGFLYFFEHVYNSYFKVFFC